MSESTCIEHEKFKCNDCKQNAIKNLKPYARYKIANVYDQLDFSSILTLVPAFEYPNWDHCKVSELWKGR